jgi:hypothetical protein
MRKLLLLGGLALFLTAPPAVAQQVITDASLSGRVTDPSGGVVPGAQVTARQTETNQTAEAPTNQEGRFRFPYLKVGPYEVVVRLQGFADATRSLTLTIGGAFELPVTLNVGTIDTSVTVTGQATVLEAARSQIAAAGLRSEERRVGKECRIGFRFRWSLCN